MELKRHVEPVFGMDRLLLIVPYGIETDNPNIEQNSIKAF